MQTTNNQTAKQIIIDIINNHLKENQTDFNEYQAILQFLEPLEGKQVTMRMDKQLKEIGMKMIVGRDKTYIEVAATKNGHPICNNTNKVVSLETFKEPDICSGTAAQERVTQLQALLNNPQKLDKLVEKSITIKKAYEELRHAFHEIENDKALHAPNNPAYYTILKSTGVPYAVLSNIE